MNKIKTKLGDKIKLGRITPVLLFLIVLNTVSMLISNVVTIKQFDLGFMLLAGGSFIFPITYICSDIFSEVYGYKCTRFTAWLAFLMNVFMVIMFQIVIAIPGADPTVSSNVANTLGNTPWSVAAGMLAFMVGDLMNDKVFKYLKGKRDGKHFWFRALFSSFVGELIDSLIFFPLGLNILPKLFLGFEFLTWEQMLIAIPANTIFKVLVEVVLLPVTYYTVKKVRNYETTY